ncbi:MAG TPA: cupin domain-containing protein [Candidatus Saccharimonadales bacterium]|nr:cupin domain-containing protein [Candidatus Saccharimonadales bacterium]
MSESARSIRTVRPGDRKTLAGPAGSPFVRQEMFGDGHVWVGMVTTEPGGASPWHHHGEHETYVYILEGEATVEYGPGGTGRLLATADGSLHIVPPGLPHREINTGSTPNRMLVVRVGEGPAVVQLDGPPK